MKISKKIKVLVVDDSIMFREVITKGLAGDPSIEVVGTAPDAFSARDKMLSLRPDVISLDVEMPKMSGVEFLRKFLPEYPVPVVMVSGVTDAVFDALNAGAVDFVEKPGNIYPNKADAFINELIIKIKIASTAKVGKLKRDLVSETTRQPGRLDKNEFIIAIGASTGGTEATLAVIKDLPREIPGIVIVQHMPPVFTKMYADRLNNTCNIAVREAKDGDQVKPGLALVAPGGMQLKVFREHNGYYVKCREAEKVNGHMPSVDVLFDSVADAAREKAIGIILTGMGGDGAKGLFKMRQFNAYTIGQDEKSCVVYGMPMVAYNMGAVDKQCSLSEIPAELLNRLKEKNYL